MVFGSCRSFLLLVTTDTLGDWKKCPLVELSAYENYSHKRTPKKSRMDVHLRES